MIDDTYVVLWYREQNFLHSRHIHYMVIIFIIWHNISYKLFQVSSSSRIITGSIFCKSYRVSCKSLQSLQIPLLTMLQRTSRISRESKERHLKKHRYNVDRCIEAVYFAFHATILRDDGSQRDPVVNVSEMSDYFLLSVSSFKHL